MHRTTSKLRCVACRWLCLATVVAAALFGSAGTVLAEGRVGPAADEIMVDAQDEQLLLGLVLILMTSDAELRLAAAQEDDTLDWPSWQDIDDAAFEALMWYCKHGPVDCDE